MASSTTTAPVRVHDAEVSTDRAVLAQYAEPLLAIVAVAALAATAWVATRPAELAELQQPGPARTSPAEVGAPGATSSEVGAAPGDSRSIALERAADQALQGSQQRD